MNLEILLGLTALILFTLGGEANVPVHHPALLHGSIRMSYSPSQKMGTIKSITWKFDNNGKRVTILDTTEKPYYVYDSQFRERLVMSDDLYTMSIMDLTLEDGGIYIVEVADTNGRTDFSSYNVTVYEPTPQPTITPHMNARTSEGCNVTLNCSVPSHTSDLSYSWKSRHGDSTYQPYSDGSTIQISLPPDHQDSTYQPHSNGSTTQISLPPDHQDSTYQPYSNGRTTHISLPLDHQDMELLCIVQNPADQKNVSIRLHDACTSKENRSNNPHPIKRILIPTCLAAIFVVTVITIAVIYARKKRKGNIETKENRAAEIDYIEVTTHPREENQKVVLENDHYTGMPSPQKIKAETVYTMLQHPQPKAT